MTASEPTSTPTTKATTGSTTNADHDDPPLVGVSKTTTTTTTPSSPLPLQPPISIFDAVHMIRTRRMMEREHTDDEIHWFIQQYTNNQIPDYQMAAWLMAVCCNNGLSDKETATLTNSIVQSGQQIQWRKSPSPAKDTNHTDSSSTTASFYLVDKHSTGGVGDKVSIILAPLVAALGNGCIKVPMLAGRGLGHTGGTIDKLECSIPNIRVANQTINVFQNWVLAANVAIMAPTSTLCPADQKLYALRDVTNTIQSISLQTASIMSKKIAEHPDSIVLDVKYGIGSFQNTIEDAIVLAKSMISTGEANGLLPTTALLSHMDEPIGRAVGNWLEIRECIELMTPATYQTNKDTYQKGYGYGNGVHRLSQDLLQLVLVQAAYMIQPSNLFPNKSIDELIQLAYEALIDGRTLQQFRRMISTQGGDPTITEIDCTDDHDSDPLQPLRDRHLQPGMVQSSTIIAKQNGSIESINSFLLGQICVQLGAGRQQKDDIIDPFAGIWFHQQKGDVVTANETIIATVYYHTNRVIRNTTTTTTTTTTTNSSTHDPELVVVVPNHSIEKTIQCVDLSTILDRIHSAIQYSPVRHDSKEKYQPEPIITHRVTSQYAVETIHYPTHF